MIHLELDAMTNCETTIVSTTELARDRRLSVRAFASLLARPIVFAITAETDEISSPERGRGWV